MIKEENICIVCDNQEYVESFELNEYSEKEYSFYPLKWGWEIRQILLQLEIVEIILNNNYDNF